MTIAPANPQSRSLTRLTHHLAGLVRQRLWLQVLIALFAGVGFGMLIGPAGGWLDKETASLLGNWISLPGQLFLVAIQFVVVPLVVASVIRGITAGEGNKDLGRLGSRTVLFFLTTTLLAVVIGLAAAAVIQPGHYADGLAQSPASVGSTTVAVETLSKPSASDIPGLILNIFPKDPLSTFVSGNMLQIVIAAAIFGIALLMTPGEQRKPLVDLLGSVQAACMVIVGWVMRFAPLAVFGLLANLTARSGLSALVGTGVYALTVIAGLCLLLMAYLLLAKLIAGKPMGRFLREGREVMLLAFSTSSSASVMPVTLNTVEQGLLVSPANARFIIPLGTTINMGGTALYQGVATLFLAQVFGVELGFASLLLVVVMATGASIGSPGTPGVGIVILATILTSVGIPPAGVAIILGVDRILDMCRTMVNVFGDMTACVVIDHLMEKDRHIETAVEGPT
ncbi:dicarboxylate/amino acid:cation symporter [Aestuariispira insulae]|uniref:Na+/H+-dicarboxylate symporter n=1 Tax=Aestuariispira insulae TaxID=1461337 RepID=A0A3D9HHU2_9PROT|nr:dicarboxylate/amino acid:cation symporter [Aestuariispira insulae]RED48536.1 Na+/H+-dicarboxylate symporter [Aestuariispira insulae]